MYSLPHTCSPVVIKLYVKINNVYKYYVYVCKCAYVCSPFLRHLAAYVFGGVLARELDEFKSRWNNHRIRWNRPASCPCDVPNDLYHLVGNIGMLHALN